MPMKSKAQWKAMAAKMQRGEISKKVFDEFAHATKSYKALPEHVKPKSRGPKRRQRKKE